MKRRDFIQGAAAAAIAGAIPVTLGNATGPSNRGAPLRLLVLGGTNFVGPAIVERAAALGHEVTLFNRGITRPHLFPDLEKLRGNRDVAAGDLAALRGNRRWDAVIDVWAEQAALVETTTRLLADRADYYYFVSSIAAYTDYSEPGLDEAADVRAAEPGYGGEKVRAERAALEAFENRAGVARCHSIFGPRDPGSSLHYWLRRLSTADTVLAPGTGNDPIQWVDARDVAWWIVDCVEKKRAGVYNLASPPMPFRDFLSACTKAVNSNADLLWVSEAFLRSQGVGSFIELPLWAPLSEDPGFFQISSAGSQREGMRYRSAGETMDAAWNWYRSVFFKDTVFPHNGWGLSEERELALLSAWRQSGARSGT